MGRSKVVSAWPRATLPNIDGFEVEVTLADGTTRRDKVVKVGGLCRLEKTPIEEVKTWKPAK